MDLSLLIETQMHLFRVSFVSGIRLTPSSRHSLSPELREASFPPFLCVYDHRSWTKHSYLFESTSFPRATRPLRLTMSSCLGLAIGQILAVTPEWPDFCGIQHPRRLSVTGDRSRGSQTPQGISPQPLADSRLVGGARVSLPGKGQS